MTEPAQSRVLVHCTMQVSARSFYGRTSRQCRRMTTHPSGLCSQHRAKPMTAQRERGKVLPLEQSQVSADYWLIEGYHVRRGMAERCWDVFASSGDRSTTTVPLFTARSLKAVREWIGDQDGT